MNEKTSTRREAARRYMSEVREQLGSQLLSSEELIAADEEHAQAHETLRSNFSTLLQQTVSKAASGEDVSAEMDALLTAYNSSSETNVRLLSVTRRLRNSQLKDNVR